jgi:RNA exonuclease 4
MAAPHSETRMDTIAGTRTINIYTSIPVYLLQYLMIRTLLSSTPEDTMATTLCMDHNNPSERIAIDCEMMQSNIGQVLGRVSVVDYEGVIILDTFVCYPEPVTIKSTDRPYSGIDWGDIEPQNGAQPFLEVQAQLTELLRGRIVIGHDIEKDLKVISINLPSKILRLQGIVVPGTPNTLSVTIRDTQKYSGYRQYASLGANQGPSLKNLALHVLGRQIKQGQVSSVEDAVATMEIYRNAEAAIDQEQRRWNLTMQ